MTDKAPLYFAARLGGLFPANAAAEEAMKEIDDIIKLRELLDYNPETGELTWRPRPIEMFFGERQRPAQSCAIWNGRFANKPAMTARDKRGYLTGRLFYTAQKAHRVAWAIHHGAWPKGEIDHIDGDPANNRIANLRDVSHAENGRNLKRSRANSSGVTGVHKARSNNWVAAIDVDGARHHLGTFPTFKAAAEARKVAEREHGFHPNHGGRQ